ncbi:transcription elongation factor SPT4 isoform X5 [Rattus norvegicus]|uniref:transcription elongation factor SPT4 isoform X5 n=1 Tax=Rattus norvegicus TaxID=10116 RepID=UPI001916D9F4|nr:transcription elongation factor SPT4 isoform X3 [Rattus norvegicus]
MGFLCLLAGLKLKEIHLPLCPEPWDYRIIAMMSPEDSWVSKWQRVSNFKPGVYAVSVTGRLPQGIVRELKSRGVAYKSRDTAIKT